MIVSVADTNQEASDILCTFYSESSLFLEA